MSMPRHQSISHNYSIFPTAVLHPTSNRLLYDRKLIILESRCTVSTVEASAPFLIKIVESLIDLSTTLYTRNIPF